MSVPDNTSSWGAIWMIARPKRLSEADLPIKRTGAHAGREKSIHPRPLFTLHILDGDDAGAMAAEAMSHFGAQKNRHFFQLARADYKAKGGKSWDVEIEDMLSRALVEAFVWQYPDAVEERMQRRDVLKLVINGRSVKKGGQTYDY
jgi:hypothetical protein